MVAFNSRFPVVIYFIGLLVFCFNCKHLLLILMSLEFIALSLYFILFIFLSIGGFDYYLSIIYLTIAVCEGSLGLSILVAIIRSYGNDYFQSFRILW